MNHEKLKQIIGHSTGVQQVRNMIERIAPTSSTVLILGESGTGKELVARMVHELSTRCHEPFVAVNCAAIPSELLESELFGHEKGAFTGAIATRQGRFELAEGGTLFLDEIGDMPQSMQVKLLRVLQERVFQRVGGNRSIEANVRIIAATNQNLESAIQAGTFREDLFYRLNVFPIEIPPLRHRREDIILLTEYFVTHYASSESSRIQCNSQALHLMVQYDWPGNIRELSNLIERLCILHPGQEISERLLPEKMQRKPLVNTTLHTTIDYPEGFDLKKHLNDLEIQIITQALQDTEWVVAKAAKRLGLRRTTLVEKMKKFELKRTVLFHVK